jgi:hypothetical protein
VRKQPGSFEAQTFLETIDGDNDIGTQKAKSQSEHQVRGFLSQLDDFAKVATNVESPVFANMTVAQIGEVQSKLAQVSMSMGKQLAAI